MPKLTNKPKFGCNLTHVLIFSRFIYTTEIEYYLCIKKGSRCVIDRFTFIHFQPEKGLSCQLKPKKSAYYK